MNNMNTYKPHKDFHGELCLTMKEYLDAPGINKHSLDDLAKSPAYYMDKQTGRVKERDAEHNRVGNALHALFFERKQIWVTKPETYTNDKGEIKPFNANSNTCKKWFKDHEGECVLTKDQALWIEETCEALRHDHHVKMLPRSGKFERSLFVTDLEFGFLLKTRPDWFTDDGIFIDLKTTTNAATDAFAREIFKYRYHVQAAMARRVARFLGMPFKAYYYVIVEKSGGANWTSEPARINVRELTHTAIDLGNFRIEDGLTLLHKCKASGLWPDYSGDSDKIQWIDVPAWAYTESINDDPIIVGGKEVII